MSCFHGFRRGFLHMILSAFIVFRREYLVQCELHSMVIVMWAPFIGNNCIICVTCMWVWPVQRHYYRKCHSKCLFRYRASGIGYWSPFQRIANPFNFNANRQLAFLHCCPSQSWILSKWLKSHYWKRWQLGCIKFTLPCITARAYTSTSR